MWTTLPRLPSTKEGSYLWPTPFRDTSLVSKQPISIHTPLSNKPILAPFIAEKIAQQRKWQQPRPKQEAYTFAMLSKFNSQVVKMETSNPNSFLQLHSLVFNTQCLGIFTGGRVSEYSQSKGKLTDVSCVPAPPGTPTELIIPITFVAGDFVFLLDKGIKVPHSDLFRKPNLATQLLLTFRHDKSGRNYAVRKYGKGRDWLCPIKAALINQLELQPPGGCETQTSRKPCARSASTHIPTQIIFFK
jgi:hypothetical protein